MTDTTHQATPTDVRCELNGEPAGIEALSTVALLAYGHFSSMQVLGGGVPGLDLHLARLDAATRELFGTALDLDAVRAYMRNAVAHHADASLRVNVFSRALKLDHPATPAKPDVLTTLGPPRKPATKPVHLQSVRYQRELPHIKHVATFGLFNQRRIAQLDGFDDALFVDPTGALSEASVWNIGFFDGDGIVWPDAPALAGITMQLLQKALRGRGIATASRRVALADVGLFRSAFLCNTSCIALPVASIDGVELAVDPKLVALLEACYADNPIQAL
ncbi:MAG TPA: aminotransferase class IV family protein [Rhodanobacteraceae bacterium]|nr:aminotransferase class IV family protein [Rhodanobacteraceae bacterium]